MAGMWIACGWDKNNQTFTYLSAQKKKKKGR